MIEVAVIVAVLAVILLPFAFVAADMRNPQRENRRLARRHGCYK